MKSIQISIREQYINELHKLRKHGWESDLLLYNIPFNEETKTDAQIMHHVWRIEKHKADVIEGRIKVGLGVILIVGFIILMIFR